MVVPLLNALLAIVLVLLALGGVTLVAALDNGLGKSPPMGWNSWNHYGCTVNETVIREAANLLVDHGLAAHGYRYVNIDDCWMAAKRKRSTSALHDGDTDNSSVNSSSSFRRLRADPIKFPSGMKHLGDYIHRKGLLYGIYSSAGTKTCQGLPGSLNFEELDAQTFASWGVDYLKYDNCFNHNIPSYERYPKMRDALNATGRPIFYSLCQWGVESSWRWAPVVGNAWRTTEDIRPDFGSIRHNFLKSQQHVLRSSSQQSGGAWADPDMLEVGNGDLTIDEEESHFALWSLAKAPLILGMDLKAISKETLSIITNRNLIAINQDPMVQPATCFVGCPDGDNDDENVTSTGAPAWSAYATVSEGDTVALLINWHDESSIFMPGNNATMLAGQDLGVVPTESQSVVVTNLYTNETIGTFDFDSLKALPIPPLRPHQSIVIRLAVIDMTASAPASPSLQIDNGIAHVPPMGWNSWNVFGCNVTERVITDVVREVTSSNLSQLGYRYVNVDDCWMASERNSDTGQLRADPDKFPSGMKLLGDLVHEHGLLYGLYSSAGTRTCQGLPASLGMERIDAQTFASWGVDYLKYDNCYNQGIPSIDRYPIMRDALNATGRPIFFLLCQWGDEDSWRWAPSIGNGWRSTRDISPHFGTIKTNFLQNQKQVHRSQPGAWADPDMLEVGNGNLTIEENKSHFALWALAKAPLWLGMDLTRMTPQIRAIISNENLITVNQDPGALPATCFLGCSDNPTWSVYATRVTGGDTVAIVVNWQDDTLLRRKLGGYDIGVVPLPNEKVKIVDLWANQAIGILDSDSIKTLQLPSIPPHGCKVYRFSTLRNDHVELFHSTNVTFA